MIGTSPVGAVLVAVSGAGIAAILVADDDDALRGDLRRRFPAARPVAGSGDDERVLDAVLHSIESPRSAVTLPLDLRGTAFQRRVWTVLTTIPPGETTSYAEVARRIGAPVAVRAVASACAANRHAIVIPCHRVLRSDGALSGYAWGIERKRLILQRERRARSLPVVGAADLPRRDLVQTVGDASRLFGERIEFRDIVRPQDRDFARGIGPDAQEVCELPKLD